MKNPTCIRDELILALDVYLRHGGNPPGKTSDEVAELSRQLNQLGQTLGHGHFEKYRNPKGVYMKMMNFRRFDPAYTSTGGKGLSRGGSGEESVWNEFADDQERLRRTADAIRANIRTASESPELASTGDDDLTEASEGRLVTRLHRNRERSRKLVERKKASFKQEHGRLFCEACGFEPSAVYGESGEPVIECHHTKPVHTLRAESRTNLDDLVLPLRELPSSGAWAPVLAEHRRTAAASRGIYDRTGVLTPADVLVIYGGNRQYAGHETVISPARHISTAELYSI